MPPSPPSLARLQRWMRAAIAGDGAAATRRLAAIVLPSRTLAPAERVACYARMYRLRLRECLEGDFAAVAFAIGHAAFDRLAFGFVRAHPSRSYNLNRFGAALPTYAASRRWLPRRDFVAGLARLEWAIVESFDAYASPAIDRTALRRLAPGDWERVRFRLSPTVRLLAFGHPVNAYFQRFRDGHRPAPPPPRPSWLAVYRRDFVVWRADLSSPMFRLLVALRDGAPLGVALRRALRGSDLPHPERAVQAWFRDWASEGFFDEIVPPGRRGVKGTRRESDRGERPSRRASGALRAFASETAPRGSAEAAPGAGESD